MLSTCYVSIDSAKCSKIRTVHVSTSNELSVKKSGKFFICHVCVFSDLINPEVARYVSVCAMCNEV